MIRVRLLYILIFLVSLPVLSQNVPKIPDILSFSHLFKQVVGEDGKIYYQYDSDKRRPNSKSKYVIIETKLYLDTDIYDSRINTEINNIGRFLKGYKNGLWKTTYAEIPVKEENWNNGLITGEYKVYNIDKKLLYETNFVKGNGKYKDYYYKTSILKLEGNYENGKKQGEWCNYNEQGKLLKKEYFKEGQMIKKI